MTPDPSSDMCPKCGVRGCINRHPFRPFVDRPRDQIIQADSGPAQTGAVDTTAGKPLSAGPLSRRIAALTPSTPWRPAWLRQASAKDLTGGLR